MHAARELGDVLARGDLRGIGGYDQWPIVDHDVLAVQRALGGKKYPSKRDADDNGQTRHDKSQPLQNSLHDFLGHSDKARAFDDCGDGAATPDLY
jgi:hypothetical protein